MLLPCQRRKIYSLPHIFNGIILQIGTWGGTWTHKDFSNGFWDHHVCHSITQAYYRWHEKQNFKILVKGMVAKNEKNQQNQYLYHVKIGSFIKIRTWTKWIKTICATVTPWNYKTGTSTRIRTEVKWVRATCPWPLDDGGIFLFVFQSTLVFYSHISIWHSKKTYHFLFYLLTSTLIYELLKKCLIF